MANGSEFQGVLDRVRGWPPELRLMLAEELLRLLHPAFQRSGPRGIPAEQIRGLTAGDAPPPADELVKQWIDQGRMEKYA